MFRHVVVQFCVGSLKFCIVLNKGASALLVCFLCWRGGSGISLIFERSRTSAQRRVTKSQIPHVSRPSHFPYVWLMQSVFRMRSRTISQSQSSTRSACCDAQITARCITCDAVKLLLFVIVLELIQIITCQGRVRSLFSPVLLVGFVF